jgi:hypothetical protein
VLGFLLAAALAPRLTTQAIVPDAALRIVRSANPHRRYVRLHLDIELAGRRGTEISVIDLATGRSSERISAGPLSGGDGFDGTVVWSADSTGMPLIEGNADERLDVFAAAHFFGRTGPERPGIRVLRSAGGTITVRVAYRALPGPIDVTIDRATGRLTEIVDRSDPDVTATRFSDYRRIGDTVLPFRIDTTDRYGPVHERVRSVEFPNALPAKTFSPPPEPNDVALDGIATIPMRLLDGVPVVPIRINGGPELHVLLDSGASNFLKPRAARKAGLQPIGNDLTGGMGPGTARERYTTARRLRIGTAELRDQPFSVIDDDVFGSTVDGAIGCEVLQRFATRIDFTHRNVELSRNVERFAIGPPAIPLHLNGCTPEVDGVLDGIRGRFTIDTGSSLPLSIYEPAVRRYGLRARYTTGPLEKTGGGIGGGPVGYFALARSLQLGATPIGSVWMALSAMRAGAEADPTTFGNVGAAALDRFVLVFDYRGGRMWLL